MPDSARRVCSLVVALACVTAGSSQSAQVEAVGRSARLMDVAFLDSLLGPRMLESVTDAHALAARDALVASMVAEENAGRLEWAVMVHGWLRAAGDAHMRVPFDRLSPGRTRSTPPSAQDLVAEERPWSQFGPGLGVPASARAAWLARTWPWVACLADGSMECPIGQAKETESDALSSGIRVEDHGAFLRWVIPSFGTGDDRSFRTVFRKQVRQLARAGRPVMLDLRGNLGGFRSRRHAVLGVFLDSESWPVEREGKWSMDGEFDEVPAMPLASVRRALDVPVAVMLDGLSFSASLLLAQSLEESGRARVFGCAPLGGRGGCSGNPESWTLPGSGLEVLIPSRQTELGVLPASEFDLPAEADCDAGAEEWSRAVLWLLSSDLAPTR